MIETTGPTEAAYADAPGHVALALESDRLHGLCEVEAANRLERFGPNLLRGAERPSYLRIAVRQLSDPLTGLLLAAAGGLGRHRGALRGGRHRGDRLCSTLSSASSRRPGPSGRCSR